MHLQTSLILGTILVSLANAVRIPPRILRVPSHVNNSARDVVTPEPSMSKDANETANGLEAAGNSSDLGHIDGRIWRSSFKIYILKTGKDFGDVCEFRGRFSVEGEGGYSGMKPINMDVPKKRTFTSYNEGRGEIIFDYSWFHPIYIINTLYIDFYESSEPYDKKQILDATYQLPKLNLTLLRDSEYPFCQNVVTGSRNGNVAVVERCVQNVRIFG